MDESEAFFAKLPAGRLNAVEGELRDLLRKAAICSRRLLPISGAVPLQEWVAQRIATEVNLGHDSMGNIILELVGDGASAQMPVEAASGPPPSTSRASRAAAPSAKPAAGPPKQPGVPPSRPPLTGASATFAANKEAFFKKLPPDAFTPEEESLRTAVSGVLAQGTHPLIKLAGEPSVSIAAKALLPRGVPLVEWIERRIGAEVQVATDERGCRLLSLSSASSKEEKKENFFAGLPDGEFTAEEAKLREALLDFLRGWTSADLATLSHAGGDRRVQLARQELLPQGVTLRDWIERRIGGELELRRDEKTNQYVVHLLPGAKHLMQRRHNDWKRGDRVSETAGPEATEAKAAPSEELKAAQEAFFEYLPDGEFLPKEAALREALLDFLAGWTSKDLATLSHAGNDKRVQKAKQDLLPPAVPLREWIERRIGGELDLIRDEKGQFVVHLLPAAQQGVRERFQKLIQGGRSTGGPDPDTAQDPAMTSMPEVNTEGKEAFWISLPEDELLPVEVELRQALLDFLDAWRNKPGIPLLRDAVTDKAVQEWKDQLLPKEVTFKEWIDQRIGGEVITRRVPSGQVQVFLKDAEGAAASAPSKGVSAKAAVPKAKGKAEPKKGSTTKVPKASSPPSRPGFPRQSEPPEAQRDPEEEVDKEATKALAAERKEAFFADLPDDHFTPEEEAMREAIISFIENYRGDPRLCHLSAAGSDAQVREARKTLLPKECNVSIREWIERRIGGEVETRELPEGNSQIAIGLRGQMKIGGVKRRTPEPEASKSHWAAAAASKAMKRRAPEPDSPKRWGGSSAAGKGDRGAAARSASGPARTTFLPPPRRR